MTVHSVSPSVRLVENASPLWVRLARFVGLGRFSRRVLATPRWKIELEHFKQFETALGRDVLAGFCRCFVHADRLTSTISAIYASQQLHGRESVAFGRDLHTLVWFTIGTLRELALGIRELRAALKKRGILDSESEQWLKLREVEKRWEDDEAFRRMRDKAAFHVDPDIIDKGLDELLKERDVELSQGEGPKSVNASLSLGFLAMHHGLGMDLDAYREFLESVSGDHGITDAIQEAFVLAARSAGIPFGNE
jgi:hypothetical protein